MSDGNIAVSIARGELAGLAAAYDRYAVSLYGYCHSLLIYPADAADAVHDTFIIAWTKIPCLHDSGRLPAWLFAMARKECHSRPHAGALSAPRTGTGEMTGQGYDADVGDAELQYLVRAALTGLEPAEREIIELNVRYELEGADLADALGVPRGQAQTLTTRARSRFAKVLGLLLAVWPVRDLCPGAAGLLGGWDGTLTAALCKRLRKHIRRCSVCGRIRHHEIRPEMLLALLPAAVLPDRLWQRVIGLVTDDSSDAADQRLRISRRAEPLTSSGFPVQARRPPAPRMPSRYALIAGAATAAVALLGGGAFLVNYSTSHSGQGPFGGAYAPTRSSSSARTVKVVSPAPSSHAPFSPASHLTPAPATSSSPVTLAPTTKAPTKKAPTTKPPTTKPPTTPAPSSTTPATPAPSSTTPTTPAPSSTTPTTPAPSGSTPVASVSASGGVGGF
jgi:RNA polymerase sigma factor (sigma-70 family)